MEDDSLAQLNHSSNQGARILFAWFLPTISVVLGRVLVKSIKNYALKTVYVGFSFIAFKATLKIIMQYDEHIRKRHKKVLDYNEANLLEFKNDRAYLDSDGTDIHSNW